LKKVHRGVRTVKRITNFGARGEGRESKVNTTAEVMNRVTENDKRKG